MSKTLLRHLPKFGYRGLTIVMSNPSRFDFSKLLDGVAGLIFCEECLAPELNRWQCDIRLVEDESPFLPETKVILLLGQKALNKFMGKEVSLDDYRGSPFIYKGMVCIATFTAQDACDMKNYESKFNEHLKEEEEFEEGDSNNYLTAKSKTKTARANYRFWVKADTKKAIRILENGGKIPDHGFKPEYDLYPTSAELIDVLTNTKNDSLYFDLETDLVTGWIRCIGFMFGSNPNKVYVFQLLDLDYKPAYGEMAEILKAFSIAISDNECIAHNGATFDFFMLAYLYGFAVGNRLYDTMLAHSRIYPKIESSLGHCVSYYTYEPFHKDEGNHAYRTLEQARQLMFYCGKDVFTMFLVRKGQDEMCAKDPGLRASVDQINRAIRPYMLTTLLGIKYNEEKRQAWIKENDELMNKYLEYMSILTGPQVPPLISNQTCVYYFHKLMGYPVVMRTEKGGASLKADALYKLATKVSNPVMKFLLLYREKQKETGTLQFKVWRQNEEQVNA